MGESTPWGIKGNGDSKSTSKVILVKCTNHWAVELMLLVVEYSSMSKILLF